MVLRIIWFSFKRFRPYLHVQVTKETPYIPHEPKNLVSRLIQKGESLWISYSQAPPNSLKGTLYTLGTRLMARLPPQEFQLRKLYNVDLSRVNGNASFIVSDEIASQPAKVLAWLGRQEQFHGKWWRIHAFMTVPVTILTILPGVKAVLAWIIFRAVTHWRAQRGSKLLYELVNQGKIKMTTEPLLNEIRRAESAEEIGKLAKDLVLPDKEEHLAITTSILQHLNSKQNIKDVSK
jgi:hypothetical protein